MLVIAAAGCQPVSNDIPAKFAHQAGAPVFVSSRELGRRPALLLKALADSGVHGRDPSRYLTADLREALARAQSGDSRALKKADRQLMRAFIHWARDLDLPRGTKPIVTDPAAEMPAFDSEAALLAAATAPDLAKHLERLQRRHPIYGALSQAYRAELAAGRKGEQLAINLERARWLPASPQGKHIVVDAAGARLWMYDGVRQVGSMNVVAGRPEMPTPFMSGVIRYVVVHPYWNVPVDIVRDSIAPDVVRQGPAVIAGREFEILADWSPTARPVAATSIDWRAVARGDRALRVRQRPGPDNMMGRVKFMLPNDLGIYLHDTPKIADFAKTQRAKSSGCVRVADAPRLARWLFDGADPLTQKGKDLKLALPRPVPVYISYFTVSPVSGGHTRFPDVYRRDID